MTKWFVFVLALALLLPAIASAQAPQPHAVDLTWIPSVDSGAGLGYNLYRSTIAGGPYTKVNLVPVVGTAFTDTNVQGTQTYFYVARTSLNAVESVNSNEAKAVIPLGPASGLSAAGR